MLLNGLEVNQEYAADEWVFDEFRPVLDVKVYFHQGRYCIDIVIESLFRDRTVSWVRIVNGINKHVTEKSE